MTAYERLRERYRKVYDGLTPKLGLDVILLLEEIDRLDRERRELAERVECLEEEARGRG